MEQENKEFDLEGVVRGYKRKEKYGYASLDTLYVLIEDDKGVLYNTFLQVGDAYSYILDYLTTSVIKENQKIKVKVSEVKGEGTYGLYRAVSQYQIIKDKK